MLNVYGNIGINLEQNPKGIVIWTLKINTNEFNKNSNYDIKFTKIGLVFYVL